jgi:hypothetical protein
MRTLLLYGEADEIRILGMAFLRGKNADGGNTLLRPCQRKDKTAECPIPEPAA